MAPKAKKEAKSEKAEKPEKKEKGGKAAKAAQLEAAPAEAVDHDALEEQEEAAEEAAARSKGGGDDAAAAANTEMSASFKNFRHHPDMENFYRFIYENDLRHEALAIIDKIMVDKAEKKKAAKSKH